MTGDWKDTFTGVRVSEATTEDTASDTVIKAKPQRRWQSYIWDSLDKSPEERKFLFKLDLVLLTFASLGLCWTNSVCDQVLMVNRLLHQIS